MEGGELVRKSLESQQSSEKERFSQAYRESSN
jgi:hypothetical protein